MISNVVSFAVLWSLWKLRNELCFEGVVRLGVKIVSIRVSRMLRRWLPLYKQEVGRAGLQAGRLPRRPAQIE